MNYIINGMEYRISEYDDGFAWVTDHNEGLFAYPTELEALQNAMDVDKMVSDAKEIQLALKQEEEKYGSYETQVNNLYKGTRL